MSLCITWNQQFTGRIDTSEAIPGYKTDTSDLCFIDGKNVTPSTALVKMRIFKIQNNVLSLVYTQDPIDDSSWYIEKQYRGDFGLTINTFFMSDGLLGYIHDTLII